MAEKLKTLYDNLFEIRKYLIKIGPDRRKGNIVVVKLVEADDLVQQYNLFLEYYSETKSTLSESECSIIHELCSNFDKLYEQILDLCSKKAITTINMTNTCKFDLKTALNLLPVCSNDEASVKQLIDGIEYYTSELDEKSQEKLIKFVLKTRLSQPAKLKLSPSYANIDELITDLKAHLLPKKSASAIQRKLQNYRQNDLSIDEFGKQVTELFVDLTLTQSDGSDANFKVLKPINEKQAIKCFADGLRSRRLGTIISARTFPSLKDAVQAAIDEDNSIPSTSSDILTMNSRGRTSYNWSQRRGRFAYTGRGRGRGYRQPSQNPDDQQDHAGRGSHAGRRGSTRSFYGNRGRSNFHNNSTSGYQHVHTLENSDSQENSTSEEQNENQFFRD